MSCRRLADASEVLGRYSDTKFLLTGILLICPVLARVQLRIRYLGVSMDV